jgi:hypothetical protein
MVHDIMNTMYHPSSTNKCCSLYIFQMVVEIFLEAKKELKSGVGGMLEVLQHFIYLEYFSILRAHICNIVFSYFSFLFIILIYNH